MNYLRKISLVVVILMMSTVGSTVLAKMKFEYSFQNMKVVGVIKDDAGATIPNGVITFKNKKLEKKVNVDENGVFEIDLPRGVYKVIAKVEGCNEFRMKELNITSQPLTKLEMVIKCPPTPIY